MGTEVRGVRYDVARRTGQLHIPDGCCCDMQACIDLLEGIDAHVEVIFTYVGGKVDNIYSRTNGRWFAIPAEDMRPMGQSHARYQRSQRRDGKSRSATGREP
jgi:hypothetical protein